MFICTLLPHNCFFFYVGDVYYGGFIYKICGDISWTLVGRVICINIVYVYVFVYRDRGRGMRVAGSTIDHW